LEAQRLSPSSRRNVPNVDVHLYRSPDVFDQLSAQPLASGWRHDRDLFDHAYPVLT